MARGKRIYLNQRKYNALELPKFASIFRREYKQHGGG